MKIEIKKKEMVEISSNEKMLLIALRERFTHGEVVIVVREGEPQYIKRAWENEEFTKIQR